MWGAGNWTPVLSAGERGAVAVHLVELGHVAGELLEGGLDAAAWTAERPRRSRAVWGAGDWTPVLSAGERGAVAVTWSSSATPASSSRAGSRCVCRRRARPR
ncbi:hypothetical protein WME94_44705 [Sorangium sp. So ce429]